MKQKILRATKILKKGGLIGFPTETVYGLGADALNNKAVLKIFSLKKRPKFNPLICHFNNIKQIKKNAILSKKALKIAKEFWPGPLTLILKKRHNTKISNLVSAGLNTIACRIPSNLIALKILNEFNGIIAAPSANLSSKLSSTTAKHVKKNFGKKIYLIDGGNTKYGIESTIIDLSNKIPSILRPGIIHKKDIIKILPNIIYKKKNKENIKSPGQLKKHYSPNIPIRINIKKVKNNEVLLNFGKNNLKSKIKELNLSKKSNLEEAAKNLFNYLHILDNKKYDAIAIAPIKNKGIGIAINDKLKRASFNE